MKDLPIGIQSRLLEEHAALNGHLDQLLEAFRTGDRDAATAAYREVEARLAAHIAMEEQLLFPGFAEVDPGEAKELRAEHAEIRKRLDELGVGVELHRTKLPQIEELAQLLRRHGMRENQVLYRWADQTYDEPAMRQRLDDFFFRGMRSEPTA